MEDEQLPPFDSIKHRSIELVKCLNTSVGESNNQNQHPNFLKANISNTQLIPKVFIFVGIIPIIIGFIMISIKYFVIKVFGYIIIICGVICLSYGIILCCTIKYIFEFNFTGPKLMLKISGFFPSNDKVYSVSQLDYIIIDQMHVENDDEEKEEIPSKIIVDSIDEGYDEIFSGSGKPPLFTNDEVQYFNQFMKININKKTN